MNKEVKQLKRKLKIEIKKGYVKAVKLTNGCKSCGYSKMSNVLQFDHIDRSLKKIGVSDMVGKNYNLDALKNEINKCDILCANCHSEKTFTNKDYLKLGE